MSAYRAYVLRSPQARPEDQTTTVYRGVAEAAYRLLLRRATLHLYPPGAEVILTHRNAENRPTVLCRQVVPDIDPAAVIPLPAGPLHLAVPTGTPWPVEGRAADGSMILRPGFIDAVEAASGLLPGSVSEDQVAALLHQWYVARRKMGAPACPWTEALLREVEDEDGLPPGAISRTMRPEGGSGVN